MFLCVLFTVAIVAVGVYGYVALGGGATGQDAGQNGGEATGQQAGQEPALKTIGERILYISITGAAVILLVFIIVAWRTMSLYRELDKIIELNKRGDFSPEVSMRKLGSIGEKITQLYFTLNSLNERKTLKISALSSLADFFVDNVDIPLIATDVQGHIVYVSRRYIEESESARSDIISRSVAQVFPDVPFRDSVVELDRSNTPVEVEEAEDPLTLVGIRNRKNELSYVVWLFDGSVRLPHQVSPKKKTKSGNYGFRRVFGRRNG